MIRAKMDWVVGIWAGATCLIWTFAYLNGARAIARLPVLSEVSPPQPETWPRLSVVIPACNEASTLEEALGTLLDQDYPELQVVLVDDRSSDGTGAIVDRMAASDERIVAVHVTDLPEAWLGKVHALHVGVGHADGQWVLFADADVHYTQGALRQAVALATDRKLDHLPVFPTLVATSVLHQAVLTAFGGMFFQAVQPEHVADPDKDAYAGVGAFNMVRREAFDRTEGFEWLRMEVADDVGLGLLMQRAGARAEVWLGHREISVLWYDSLSAMVRGLEKNMFAVAGQYRLWLLLVRLAATLLIVLGPFAGFFHSTYLAVAAAVSLSTIPVFGYSLSRNLGYRFLPTLLTPVGQLIMTYIMLRSTWVCLRQGGISWRGTHYPLAQLRELQRVKL